jgi:nucleoside 2-deoxyribosyltransferase
MIDIYLAIPYSIYDHKGREASFGIVNKVAAKYIMQGKTVFSPISHSHPIAQYGTPATFDFWREFDLEMLSHCDKLVVVCLEGWENSEGISAEVNAAIAAGKEIFYMWNLQ